MRNEKNGFTEIIEFEGTLKECENYIKATKEELEQEENIEISEFCENYLNGYGGYGEFTYEII